MLTTRRYLLTVVMVTMNHAWAMATRGIGKLTLRENSHLLRSAGQADRAHERLYRLLGVDGERPQLIIRT
jgi:hypothetical protein